MDTQAYLIKVKSRTIGDNWWKQELPGYVKYKEYELKKLLERIAVLQTLVGGKEDARIKAKRTTRGICARPGCGKRFVTYGTRGKFCSMACCSLFWNQKKYADRKELKVWAKEIRDKGEDPFDYVRRGEGPKFLYQNSLDKKK